ncbi:MAG: hypothetical protein AAGU75_24010, partial [Bacillota bacterium]
MNKLERILYIMPTYVYPPDTGPRHHTFGLLKYCAQKYECHLAGFSEQTSNIEQWYRIEEALPNTHVVKIVSQNSGPARRLSRLNKFFRGLPVSLATYENLNFASWLSQATASGLYDLIHFDTFNVSLYRRQCGNVPTVLIPYDAYSMEMRNAINLVQRPLDRLKYLWKWLAYSRFERHQYRHFTKVCPVS